MPFSIENQTKRSRMKSTLNSTPRRDTSRSIDPRDYQDVARPVAAMAKSFAAGQATQPHSHPRDQLIYAVSGVMRVRSGQAAWIVPPDRAVYMPAGVEHAVATRGRVEMRTLYIRPGAAPGLPSEAAVLEVSDLMRALVLALLEEPIEYDEGGRAGLVAQLALAEIGRARQLALVIPMPHDARLARLCEALLAEPGRPGTLDELSAIAGASPRTLARLFQRETGLTFTAWRQRVRFYNALEALVAGEPVGRVAWANGYGSASAFTAAFRRTLGAPPSALLGGRDAGALRG
jgi:AraC-like DNA-binding protein/quercetin dioxygenase-like cupin family protein